MNDEMITVTLSKERLESLREAIAQKGDWSNTYLNDKGYVPAHLLPEFDAGMTEWQEDIANAAESLMGTIKELDK
jgi:hypothetical protein